MQNARRLSIYRFVNAERALMEISNLNESVNQNKQKQQMLFVYSRVFAYCSRCCCFCCCCWVYIACIRPGSTRSTFQTLHNSNFVFVLLLQILCVFACVSLIAVVVLIHYHKSHRLRIYVGTHELLSMLICNQNVNRNRSDVRTENHKTETSKTSTHDLFNSSMDRCLCCTHTHTQRATVVRQTNTNLLSHLDCCLLNRIFHFCFTLF